MFKTRLTKSPLNLLASTCLAGLIVSAVCVQQANAWVPEIPMPKCQEEVDQQIIDLTKLEEQKNAELANLQKALADDRAALAKADAAGEPAIDLARQVSDEERTEQDLKDEIQHIDIVIERDRLLKLPPCKPPVTAEVPGTIPVSGPLVPPPVDPPVNPPVDPPYHPTSGFIDPPPHVDPPEEPGRWERIKRWCRGFFECQTEEDEKREHNEALRRAREERRAQTGTEQTGANTANGTSGHTAHTPPVEDHARTATVRSDTAHVANTGAAVRGQAVANHNAIRNVAPTRVSGLQTTGLGSHMTGLGGVRTGGLGGLGGTHMGGLGGVGGMHMGGLGGLGGMRMGGFGGLGAMHMGGMGAMHVGGMGGMHMGGMGGMRMGGFARH